MPIRRTKIVATLGPSSNSRQILEKLIVAGMDIARINFSHGSTEEHRKQVELVRSIASEKQRFIAILGDLQGPKIRIARFKKKYIELKTDSIFTISTAHPPSEGNQHIVGIDYPDLVKDCRVNDELLLDDGRIVLQIYEMDNESVHCTVHTGGMLSDHKGINRRGGGLSAPTLTEKDKRDIKLAAKLEIDYLAISFPRNASDMEYARRLCKEAGASAWLVSKIERAEAVADDDSLNALIKASDAVMVARGDLGVEIGEAGLVGIQKKIIQHARRYNKAVIVATQMMESMIQKPFPTRAEVSDVANAVLDYTDAVMLSAESAAGSYPVEAVQAMDRICIGAEKHPTSKKSTHRLGKTFERCDQSIALSAMYTANHFPGIRAIIALTESAYTPLIMSRIRSSIPIYAFSPHRGTQARTSMFRGVYTIPFNPSLIAPERVCDHAINELIIRSIVNVGDWVILTKGDYYNATGGTNGMKILRVGDKII